MAYKNTVRNDVEKSYYHVYNRGIGKMDIFRDDEDYSYFEYLLERCLAKAPKLDKFGREIKNFNGEVLVHAYCLMPNHFHFLMWQKNVGGIKQLLKSVNIAYSTYFNRKYKRRGPIYETIYKSVLVEEDEHLMHVSRYIHLNPIGYRLWDYSSYGDYVYGAKEWVETEFVLGLFPSRQKYLDFVDDYESVKRDNDRLKAILGEF